jgi:hypothetical protein
MPEVTVSLRVRFLVSEDCKFVKGGKLDDHTTLDVRYVTAALVACPLGGERVILSNAYEDVTVTQVRIE